MCQLCEGWTHISRRGGCVARSHAGRKSADVSRARSNSWGPTAAGLPSEAFTALCPASGACFPARPASRRPEAAAPPMRVLWGAWVRTGRGSSRGAAEGPRRPRGRRAPSRGGRTSLGVLSRGGCGPRPAWWGAAGPPPSYLPGCADLSFSQRPVSFPFSIL